MSPVGEWPHSLQLPAELVSQAFALGFRGVDTACQPKHYEEHLVGDALYQLFSSGTLKREEVWVQTKFTPVEGQDPDRLPYDPDASLEEQVCQSVEASLENLRVDTIDSLVLHGLLRGRDGVDGFDRTMTVWRSMEKAVDEGKVRHIGISNQSGIHDPGGWWLVSANFERLVLGCIEANFCK